MPISPPLAAAVRERRPAARRVYSVFVLALMSALLAGPSSASQVWPLDLSAPLPAVQRDHLDLGGRGPNGRSIAVNSFYIERDGRPFIPIIGEFHYCRYPAGDWEQELRKIKAGGVNTVATYVFWNLHERAPGTFDWSGDLDLRRFVTLAGQVGLAVIVRLGPFAHGEMRNGGLPDWLYGRALEVRSNDPQYLAYVDRLYAAIAGQLEGLLFKHGGPVIGVQLENEFQHSAAPWEIRYAGAPKEFTTAERDVEVTHGGVSVSDVENRNAGYGRDHMANLKLIARRHGLDVPLYTATGWGNAAIVPRGSIPVTAAYAYPFWTETPEPSPFYRFKDLHRDPDYRPVSYEPELYPSMPAELGAGISPIYTRRPYVPDESIEPLIVRVLGSGSNGIGYYMYHGGATPVLDRFYNEDASGLPKINYDYQSPLGQYGRPKSHFHALKLLHLFLASYGEKLAPLPAILPAGSEKITASDTRTLRYAARAANGSGFVFLLNFQDHVEPQNLTGLRLSISDGRRNFAIPSAGEFDLPRGTSAILPVNLDLGGVPLRSATVQPLTILHADSSARFVFFSIDGLPPELVFDRGEVAAMENCRVESRDGATVVHGPTGECFGFTVDRRPVLVVPRALALHAAQARGRLVFVNGLLLGEGGEQTLLTEQRDALVTVYPTLATPPRVAGATVQPAAAALASMSAFRLSFPAVTCSASLQKVAAKRYTVHVTGGLGGANEIYLRVNYVGDTGMAFIDGALVDDHFYSGRPWELGLKRFMGRLAQQDLVLVFQPMPRTATYLGDLPVTDRPTFGPGENSRLEVHGLDVIPEYRAVLTWPAANAAP